MRLHDGIVNLFREGLEADVFLERRARRADEAAPLPATVSMTRWLSSFAYALATVLRLTRSSSASGRIDGNDSPDWMAPDATAAFTWSTSCKYTGLPDLK